ncbi:YlmC/YmxH family sporulation protein [Radiobacillus kanasensis]|uniref:YlmC/YmxH family sporulation protein n=1 Tax=Radiobacillus kanasensis TaxID=2844358 RepID=UPI001E5DF574|nr:YlmC/YmxH family sporulation protein [Radiobacillus kanasensis]UFU00955.1 YlmC/YmxH family sporulation protein [Radiobacillus kanasensis]
MITLSELQIKDIIIVEEGRRLGNITDLEIDEERGRITHLVVGNKGKVMGLFGKDEEITIPWDQILTIGTDVILIRKSGNPQLATSHPVE